MRNRFPGACRRCWQHVDADHGVVEQHRGRWLVCHDGECPPYPGYDGPTWVIDDGAPGGFHPRPEGRWTVGEVLRARVGEHAAGVPDDAPGLRRDRWTTSLIVTVLAEAEPEYCRDEDGDQPAPLIGEDGWWFRARVRPATPEEAAETLAEERHEAHRRDMETRRRTLFSFGIPADDADVPPTAEGLLDAAHDVPFGADRHWAIRPDRLLVDEDAAVVWSLTYNGADGDLWSRSNYRSYLACSQPLTEQRARLIRELRAEYELDAWDGQARIGAGAARVLIDAGWTYRRAGTDLGRFRLATAEDAHALRARAESQWQQAEWWGSAGQAGTRFAVAEARRLADAGITYARAVALDDAGFRGAEEILAASPPEVPDEPGRFLLTPRIDRSMAWARVTTDPALVREFLDTHPLYWQPVTHVPGLAPVHVTPDWSLWSDGSLVRHAEWLSVYRSSGWTSAPAPTGLADAAAHALGVLVAASNNTCQDRAIWHPLREATHHEQAELDSARKGAGVGSWTESKTLIRHDYTLPGENTASLWELHTEAGGLVNGEGEYEEDRRAYPDEPAARRAYRAHTLR